MLPKNTTSIRILINVPKSNILCPFPEENKKALRIIRYRGRIYRVTTSIYRLLAGTASTGTQMIYPTALTGGPVAAYLTLTSMGARLAKCIRRFPFTGLHRPPALCRTTETPTCFRSQLLMGTFYHHSFFFYYNILLILLVCLNYKKDIKSWCLK